QASRELHPAHISPISDAASSSRNQMLSRSSALQEAPPSKSTFAASRTTKSALNSCFYCGQIPALYRSIGCKHEICSPCLRSQRKRFGSGCPVCLERKGREKNTVDDDREEEVQEESSAGSPSVTKEKIGSDVGGKLSRDQQHSKTSETSTPTSINQDIFNDTDTSRAETEPTEYACPICSETQPESARISLPCTHDMCLQCLHNLVQNEIAEKRLPIVCPFCKSDATASRNTAKTSSSSLSPPSPNPPDLCLIPDSLLDLVIIDYTLYMETSLLIASHGEFVHCPRPRCTWGLYADANIKFLRCDLCGMKWCRSCGVEGEWHLQQSCEELRKVGGAAVEENGVAAVEKVIEENGREFKRCPKCRVAINRSEGDHERDWLGERPGCGDIISEPDTSLTGQSDKLAAAVLAHYSTANTRCYQKAFDVPPE
ncbi:hypothetical protein HK102_012918, partial [Quaeritorhiza haematococci]